MKKHIYEMPPIDFWTGWSTLETLKIQRTEMELYDPYKDQIYFENYKIGKFSQREPLEFFKEGVYHCSKEIVRAIELINQETTWEGDGRMYFTALPNDRYTETFCFAIKQGNNGTTFLCSDYDLPHLRDYKVATRFP